MAFAILYICDEALRFSQRLTDELHDIDITHLIVPADIIHLAHTAMLQNEIDGLAVILHIQPVTHILSISIDRKRLIRECIRDHERDQLLGELIRPIVIAAAGNRHRQSIRPVIRPHKKIRTCLRAAVRRARMERRLLREKEIWAIQRQIPIHLIRRHLMIPLNAILPARIHQDRRADDIRLEENLRIRNRAIHMRLRREIHDHIRMLLFKEPIDCFPVADIHLYEAEIRKTHHALQRRQIPRIRQFIQTDDAVFRMLF